MNYGSEWINRRMAKKEFAPEYSEKALAMIKQVLGRIPSLEQYPLFCNAELMVRYTIKDKEEGAPILEKDIHDMIENMFRGDKYLQ